MGAQPRIILVTRRTRHEDLVVPFNTVGQARLHVEHLGADFRDYEAEHATYRQARKDMQSLLGSWGRLQRVDRDVLPTFLFPPDALVVVLGSDGLVANTLKYLDGQPVLGVNPYSDRWEGVLVPFGIEDVDAMIEEVVDRRAPTRRVTLARVRLPDGQELHAVNDLFIGPRTHLSARYDIDWRGRSEAQSSSGVIVSTGMGSTGWLRSLRAGAAGILGAGLTPEQKDADSTFVWEDRRLVLTVREPFPSRSSAASIVTDDVVEGASLRIVSHMAESGVIFSDGIESDFIEFSAGMTATIEVAEKVGVLVGAPVE